MAFVKAQVLERTFIPNHLTPKDAASSQFLVPVRRLLPVALAVFSAVALFFMIDMSQVKNHINGIPTFVLILSSLLIAINVLLSCFRFHNLLKYFGISVSTLHAIRVNVTSIFGGVVFLNYFGQSLTRSVLLGNIESYSTLSFLLTGIERAVSLAWLLCFAIAGAGYLFGSLGVNLQESTTLFGLIVTLGTVALTVVSVGVSRQHRRIFLSHILAPLGRPVLRAGAVTVAMHAAMLSAYIVIAAELMPDAELAELAAVSAVVMLAASLPISFAGWGIRELSAAYAFGAIGLAPEAGVAVSIAIGLMSLISLGVFAAIVSLFARRRLKRGERESPASVAPAPFGRRRRRGGGDGEAGTLSARGSFALFRLAAWILPPAVAALVLFQVPLPTASGAVNVNLADPLAVVGALILLSSASFSGRWRRLWTVKAVNVAILAATVCLILGFARGYWAHGLIDWALYNRLIGWGILLCFLLTGALATSVVGRIGFSSLCRAYMAACAALVACEVVLQNVTAIGLIDVYSTDFGWRYVGMAGNPNAFAFQLVLAVAVGLPLIHRWTGRGRHGIPILLLGVILVGIVGCASRAAWGAALVLATWSLATRQVDLSSFVRMVGVATAGILALYLGVNVLDLGATGLGAAMRADLPQVQADRMASLIGGWAMWLDHPLFGAGLGAFIHQQISETGGPLVIHNTFLWITAEMGILGFAGFALLPSCVLRGAVRDRRWRKDRAMSALVGCLIVFAVSAMAHDLMYQRTLWLLAGAALAYPKAFHKVSPRTLREGVAASRAPGAPALMPLLTSETT